MTAIWPAGPPKLSAATLSQTRNASANDGIAPRCGSGRGLIAVGRSGSVDSIAGMARPETLETDAILRHVAGISPRGEIAIPVGDTTSGTRRIVKPGVCD